MSEFELLRALRDLDIPREPESDLWNVIAARIQASGPRRRPRLALSMAAAASVAVSAMLLLALRSGVSFNPGITRTMDNASAVSGRHETMQADPRLVAGAAVLDAAQAELEQALAQNPDSHLLTNLLIRTTQQRQDLAKWHAADLPAGNLPTLEIRS